MNDYITITLTKGRLADKTMRLLEKAGYYCEELKEKGIFVGLVTVCDVIAPDTKHSPELIAEKFLELYKQQDKYEIAY